MTKKVIKLVKVLIDKGHEGTTSLEERRETFSEMDEQRLRKKKKDEGWRETGDEGLIGR